MNVRNPGQIPYVPANQALHVGTGNLKGVNYLNQMFANLSQRALTILQQVQQRSPGVIAGLPTRQEDITTDNILDIIGRIENVSHNIPELQPVANQLHVEADEIEFCAQQIDQQREIGDGLQILIKEAYDNYDLETLLNKDAEEKALSKAENGNTFLRSLAHVDFGTFSASEVKAIYNKVNRLLKLATTNDAIDTLRANYVYEDPDDEVALEVDRDELVQGLKDLGDIVVKLKDLNPAVRKKMRVDELRKEIRTSIGEVIRNAKSHDVQDTYWGFGARQSYLERQLSADKTADLEHILQEVTDEDAGLTIKSLKSYARQVINIINLGLKGTEVPETLKQSLNNLSQMRSELIQLTS